MSLFGTFFIVILGIGFIGILFRNMIFSHFLGLLDFVLFFTKIKPLMNGRGSYYQGWGDAKRYEQLNECKILPKPSQIDHSFIGEQEEKMDKRSKFKRYYEQIHKFDSPLGDVLHDGERTVNYAFLTCNKEKSGDTLVIVFPASGQLGYGWRIKVLARPIMRASEGKIDCLVPIVAPYPPRVHEMQKKGGIINWMTTVDGQVTSIAMYEEARVLISHYSSMYANIIVTGFSMGSIIAAYACRSHLSEDKINLGLVSVMGATEIAEVNESYMQKLWYETDKLEAEKCAFVQLLDNCEGGRDEFESLSLVDKINRIVHDSHTKYDCKVNGGEEHPLNTNLSTFTMFYAEHDNLVPYDVTNRLLEKMKLALKRSNNRLEGEDSLDKLYKVVKFRGGHMTTFGDKMSIRKVRKEILEMMQRMNKSNK